MSSLNNDIKIIRWFLRPYRAEVFLIFLLLLVCSVLETLCIGAFYPLLNNILAGSTPVVRPGGKALEILDLMVKQIPISEPIIAASLFLLVLVVVTNIFGFFAEGLATWYRYKLFAGFLNRVYHKFLNNHYRFFLEKKQGDLLYMGLNASQSVGEMLLYFPKVGTEFFRLLTITIFLFTISLPITCGVFVILCLFWFMIHYLSVRVIHPVAVSLQDAQSELTAVFSESLAGIKQIKIFDSLKFWYDRFGIESQKVRRLSTRNVIYTSIPSRFIMVIGILSVVLSIIYVRLYKPDQFTMILPIIAVYVLALQRLMPSISNVGTHWMGLKSLTPRLHLTYDVLTDQVYLNDDGKRSFPGLNTGIELRNVNFSYPTKKDVLQNVSIQIPHGSTVAIVGESGSGKSTLADVLIRLYEPDSGSILVDGVDCREYSRSSWLRHVGMVTQDTFIFHSSVRDNIKIGKPDALDEEIMKAALTAHADQFIKELPKEYDTVVGDRGLKLSGGQRQRLAIARAIIREPDILILDEATSSLDNISEKVFQDALNEAKRDKTTIIIAHRLSTVEHADNIVVMDSGKVIEEGTHEELLKKAGIYYGLYVSQKEEKSEPNKPIKGV